MPDGLRVLACVKRVPAPGARITLTPDSQGIDTKNLGFTTSPHEECAVEEAIRLVEQHGGSSTVLTLGPPEADEQLRYAVSVGVERAVLVAVDGPDPDAQATARALVAAITAEEDAGGSLRPHPVRQRVGRRRRVPGRHPGGPGPGTSGRHRDQGHRGGRRASAR